jgi:hypothetical protein
MPSVLCDPIVTLDELMEDDVKAAYANCGVPYGRPVLTKLLGTGDSCAEQDQSSDGRSPQGDRTPSFLINLLLALTKEISGFAQAVSRFGAADASKITKVILVFLPFFNSGRPTQHGNELLQVLRAQAVCSLKEDLAPTGPASSSNCVTCVSRKRRVGPCPAPALLLHVVSWGKWRSGDCRDCSSSSILRKLS